MNFPAASMGAGKGGGEIPQLGAKDRPEYAVEISQDLTLDRLEFLRNLRALDVPTSPPPRPAPIEGAGE
jgi:hypothetical protein